MSAFMKRHTDLNDRLIVSGYAEVEGSAPDLPRLTKPFRNAKLAERLADLSRHAVG